MESIELNGSQAFALYRFPNSEEIHLVVNHNQSASKIISIQDIKSHKGFLFAPFKNNNTVELIEGKLIESIDLTKISYSISNEKNIEFNEIDFGKYSQSFYSYLNAFDESFQKAILSRPIDVPIAEDVNPIELFKALNDKYANAYISLIYTSNPVSYTHLTLPTTSRV